MEGIWEIGDRGAQGVKCGQDGGTDEEGVPSPGGGI